ncbi:MAG TPA: Ig-like domain-containing protein [Kofleriaceae bacterium]|nr:Ig-like domain-containing protein [Kofleriaceae bacterium]
MTVRPALTALISVLAASAAAPDAAAERPRGGYVVADPDLVDLAEPLSHQSNIIYLNRCVGDCAITYGNEDSRTNRSSIGSGIIQEFAHGDAAWDEVVRCVAEIYEPFGVVITDQDPGNVPHFEAIVAGRPSNIGEGPNVGGIAPFSCGIINNAITFSFANIYDRPRDICETVAQETAHAFGLDHEYLCEDPMTYLVGCGDKFFRDVDAPCGEYNARSCRCGGNTQNSYRLLLGHFDAGQPTPPTVEFVRPRPGALVQPGFAIEINAEDNIGVDSVAVWIGDRLIADSSLRPFVFDAPDDLPAGPLSIRAVATDSRGDTSEEVIEVVLGAPCTEGSCAAGEVCLGGSCVAGPGAPGGLGATCEDGGDCDSGLCGSDGSNRYCSAPCAGGQCPSGFDCIAAGEQAVCWPAEEEEGGCRASRGGRDLAGGAGLAIFALLCSALLLRRRAA